MLYAAAWPHDLNEAVSRIKRHESLEGFALAWDVLLPALESKCLAGGPQMVIQNATLVTKGKCIASEQLALQFRNCEFPESAFVVDARNLLPVSFWHVRFCRDVVFRNSDFDGGLELRNIEVAGRCIFDRCRFARTSNLSIDDCRFLGEFSFQAMFFGDAADAIIPNLNRSLQEWMIAWRRSHFGGIVDIELSRTCNEFELTNAVFESASRTVIRFANPQAKFYFTGSRCDGRVRLECNISGANNRGSEIQLDNAIVPGVIDLSQVHGTSIEWIDLHNTTFATSGALVCPLRKLILLDERFDLVNEATQHGDGDRCLTILDRKTRYSNSGQQFEQLACQYEELYNGFKRIPRADREADECKYRYESYAAHARAESVDQAWRWLALAAVSSVFAWLVIGLLYCSWDGAQIFPLSLLVGFFALSIWRESRLRAPNRSDLSKVDSSRCRRFADASAYLWNRVVLRMVLGYGVKPARPMMASAVCVVAFALFYFSMSVFAPEKGSLVFEPTLSTISDKGPFDSQEEESVAKPKIGEATGYITGELVSYVIQPSWRVVAQRSLYFSIVTFTTLGYGDVRPIGRLQLVAACEAFSGAIMIALVTVIFARRYLRL